jgi:hypothetical protein
MSEKNYVVNVKTKLGTIFTVRADTAAELNNNIKDVVENGSNEFVAALEELLLGTAPSVTFVGQVQTAPAPTSNPVDVAVAAVNGTVIHSIPVPQVVPAPTYAPAPVAVPEQGNNSVAPPCAHGTRTFVQAAPGSGKSWKAWMCPQPKGAVDKCDPQWIK